MAWRDGYIAVDWGTTNRRAYRVDGEGRLLATIEDDRGLTAVPPDGFDAEVAALRARLGDAPMLLAGMVGSKRGWGEAPYVTCPAQLADLAQAILWIEPGRTGIVPGVCQRGAVGADVMRGEEVQLLGAAAAGLVADDTLVCLPGTHAKWVSLRAGRIEAFRTLMTGEIFALLRQHSILADQLQGDVALDASFATGIDDALGGADLLSGLFRVRAGHLLGEGAESPASYASGLLIGGDVRVGLGFGGATNVALIGSPVLCALYAAAIARAGGQATAIDGGAAFRAGIHRLTELIG